MKNTKKAVLFLLTAALTASFSSCGGEASTPADTSGEGTEAIQYETAEAIETDAAGEARVYPDLPEQTFGGREFSVLQFEGKSVHTFFEYDAESLNGELMNDAVYERNARIEEQFDVVITAKNSTAPAKDAQRMVMSGDCPYSVIADRPTDLSATSAQGIYANIDELPYIDLSKPWWSASANEAFRLGGKLFFMTGDYVLFEKQRILMTFFNRQLAQNLDMPDMYQLVRDGKWTVEVMNNYAREARADLNGDGKIEITDDCFGLISGSNTYIPYMLFGCGNTFSVRNADGSYSLALSTERMISSIEQLVVTLDADYTCYWEVISKHYDGAFHVFAEGRGLFFHEVLQGVSLIDTDIPYGVLPQPKYDESQEKYLTAVQYPYSGAIAVPATVDPEFTSLILEALSADSRYTTLPTFVTDILSVKKAPDAEASEMIALSFDNIVHDLFGAFQIGGVDTFMINNIYNGKSQKYMSSVASKEESIMKAYQKLLDKYAALE